MVGAPSIQTPQAKREDTQAPSQSCPPPRKVSQAALESEQTVLMAALQGMARPLSGLLCEPRSSRWIPLPRGIRMQHHMAHWDSRANTTHHSLPHHLSPQP